MDATKEDAGEKWLNTSPTMRYKYEWEELSISFCDIDEEFSRRQIFSSEIEID